MGSLLDPAVLFFAAGLLAGLLRADLKIPEVLYETLSIYLLLAIGLKGGVQLATAPLGLLLPAATGALALGLVIPLIAYAVLRFLGRFKIPDAAALAAHYGSVSAVTFAVAIAFLERRGVPFEDFVTVLLVLLEVPAIAVGIVLARRGASVSGAGTGAIVREIFLGKSVYLLLAGLVVGAIAGPERSLSIAPLFVTPFHGVLALFLLEMGLVASRRMAELKRAGAFLAGFAIAMPLVSAVLGIGVGWLTGLTPGGTLLLATLSASASYIAAPAAMRVAVPQANPALYLTAALGITFPFNVIVGIPLYFQLAKWAHQWGG